jgi:hypothetical protein
MTKKSDQGRKMKAFGPFKLQIILAQSCKNTSLLFIKWGASQVLFYFSLFFCNESIWLAHCSFLKKLEGPRVQSSLPLAHLYNWKEDNFCQNIWDKSEVLSRTCWRTHWDLGEHIENLMWTHWELEKHIENLMWTHLELEGNIMGTHGELGKNEKKSFPPKT